MHYQQMQLETWSTFASFATLLVIAATATAAFVQLRHLRHSNQLAGLQSVFGMLVEPSVRELVNYVRHDLPDRLTDENFRAGLLKVPIDRREHPELFLCDIYNHIGSFVRNGLIDEDIYLQTEWYNVNLYWDLLRDVVATTRRDRPYLFENFEWLAARAQRWKVAHPEGDYPSGEPRMLSSD